jgi:hypothetical protein
MIHMLGNMRKGLASIGGAKVIFATLAIAWGLKTIQAVVDEASERLAMIQAAEEEARAFLNEFRIQNAPVPDTTESDAEFERLFDMDAGEEKN